MGAAPDAIELFQGWFDKGWIVGEDAGYSTVASPNEIIIWNDKLKRELSAKNLCLNLKGYTTDLNNIHV